MAPPKMPPKKPAIAPSAEPISTAKTMTRGDQQREARAVERAHQHITPEHISAEPVIGAGRLQALRDHVDRIVERPKVDREATTIQKRMNTMPTSSGSLSQRRPGRGAARPGRRDRHRPQLSLMRGLANA